MRLTLDLSVVILFVSPPPLFCGGGGGGARLVLLLVSLSVSFLINEMACSLNMPEDDKNALVFLS